MKMQTLLEDADGLIALAESVATVLSEKQHELNMDTQIEALLRASIAGATHGINMYLSALAHSRKSPSARKYLAETRSEQLCARRESAAFIRIVNSQFAESA